MNDTILNRQNNKQNLPIEKQSQDVVTANFTNYKENLENLHLS